ncbi:MAG TPA: MFS transporter, partial [Actinomycetospora sp.]|nr:MFS transporter [Actinomycetospora sp.]
RQGGTAAGVLQTGQRVGSAIGISAVGAVFFGQLASNGGDWARAISLGLIGAVAFVVLALVLGVVDLLADRRRARRKTPDTTDDDATTQHGRVTDARGEAIGDATPSTAR